MNDPGPAADSGAPPSPQCPTCGRSVPTGAFCGACGAELSDLTRVPVQRRAAQRRGAYAADPDERVLRLSLVSTLLPHIPHRRAWPFRIAFGVGAALLLVLGLLRLAGPAIAAATVAVPAVYLLYLYDVEVYEDSPWVDLGVLAVGFVLGAASAGPFGRFVTHTLVLNRAQGLQMSRRVVAAVVVPLASQLLMLVGPVVVLASRRFDEALDGFTIGAASALGFVSATTLVQLGPEIGTNLVTGGSAAANALRILQRGLFVPLIFAGTTGVIGACLWLHKGAVRRVPGQWVASLAVSVLMAATTSAAVGWTSVTVDSTMLSALVYGGVAVAVLIVVRMALHQMLLAEAVTVEIGPDMACAHCHRIVPRMAFCPHCGIAVRATPKTAADRSTRVTR